MVIKVSTLLARNTSVVNDLSPTLGGPLFVNGYPIVNSGFPVEITGNNYPITNGTLGQVLTTDGAGTLTWQNNLSVLVGDVTTIGNIATLATVNMLPQTDQFRKITVNSKGLVTATSAVVASNIITALGYTPYNATNPAGYTTTIGTVTSVALSAPSIFTTTGTPVTSTGTLALTLASQAANTVFASPPGAAGTPTFRALLESDVPTLNQSTTGSSGTLTSTRTFSATGDTTAIAQNFNGSQNVILPMVLANVNILPQTDQFRKITVNSKGLVTATSAVLAGNIISSLGYTPVSKAGDTMAGNINMGSFRITNTAMSTSPSGTDVVNVNYVQAYVAGLHWKNAVTASSISALTATYDNGASGIGATLTANPPDVLPTIDGVTLVLADRILIQHQVLQRQNGIYEVTQTTSPWILTRSGDADTPTIIDGAAVYVQQGSTLGETAWTETATVTNIGTDAIQWAQFAGSSAATLLLYAENPSGQIAPVASGANAVAIGSGSTALSTDSFAVGNGSAARITGMKAFANGSFANAGDAQQGIYILRNQTTDNVTTELFLDGMAEQIVLTDNSVYVFDILVAGHRTDVSGGAAGYRFVGVSRKDTTEDSVTFVGYPSKTVIGETNSQWDAAVAVDTGTGAFIVTVTGENASNINWVATVRTTEVTS
jgi:hypothetical protein